MSVVCQVSFQTNQNLNYFKRVSSKKKHKKPQKRNFTRNCKHMTIVFKSNDFKAIIHVN